MSEGGVAFRNYREINPKDDLAPVKLPRPSGSAKCPDGGGWKAKKIGSSR